MVACQTCGKRHWRTDSRMKLGHQPYCSKECADIAQTRKDKYECEVCGKEFFWSPSRKKLQHEVRYCSIECRNKSPDWRRARTESMARQSRKKTPNKLEQAGNDILDAMGLNYIREYPVNGKFLVDAYLPDHNIIIEWDGDYWHGYKKPLDHRQEKRVALDKSQNAYMKKCGYAVLRFWEHEVHNQPEKVRADITERVRQASA